MKLAEMTWTDVADLARGTVVLIPTGSLEQHGPHLPLLTDTVLVTAVAEAVERELPDLALLCPTLWLGASGHHLAFPGTLSASFPAYQAALTDVVGSLRRHGFHRFAVLNGHGGNAEPNGVALRALMEAHPGDTYAHANYYSFAEATMAGVLEGRRKTIAHACEAETSLMEFLHPELVRMDRAQDDGLIPEGNLPGLVVPFDLRSERGPVGQPTLASAEKGRIIFEAAVRGTVDWVRGLSAGVVYTNEAEPGG